MWAETGSTALHANSNVARKWRLPVIFVFAAQMHQNLLNIVRIELVKK